MNEFVLYEQPKQATYTDPDEFGTESALTLLDEE